MREYNIRCFSKTEERERDTKRDKEKLKTERDIKRQIQKVHIITKLHIEHSTV